MALFSNHKVTLHCDYKSDCVYEVLVFQSCDTEIEHVAIKNNRLIQFCGESTAQ